MIEFYPQIKSVHVAMIMASGMIFALRGMGALAGWRWPLSRPVRILCYAVDTTLFTAALMLVSILPSAIFANHWLLVKVGLLAVYVVLGYRALRTGLPLKLRVVLYALALLVYLFMYSIARTHHPLGGFHGLVLP